MKPKVLRKALIGNSVAFVSIVQRNEHSFLVVEKNVGGINQSLHGYVGGAIDRFYERLGFYAWCGNRIEQIRFIK